MRAKPRPTKTKEHRKLNASLFKTESFCVVIPGQRPKCCFTERHAKRIAQAGRGTYYKQTWVGDKWVATDDLEKSEKAA